MELFTNPLVRKVSLIIGGILLIFLLIIMAVFGYFFWKFSSMEPIVKTQVPEEMDTSIPTEEAVLTSYTLVGTITEVSETGFTMVTDSAIGGESFVFEYAENTKVHLADAAGMEMPAERGSLSVGSTIAVYTSEEIGSITPQIVTEVVRITN